MGSTPWENSKVIFSRYTCGQCLPKEIFHSIRIAPELCDNLEEKIGCYLMSAFYEPVSSWSYMSFTYFFGLRFAFSDAWVKVNGAVNFGILLEIRI